MNNRLKEISNVLKQRKILKNNELSKMLMNIGLYQEAANIQKPTTDVITKTSENTQKELVSIKKAIDDSSNSNDVGHLAALTSSTTITPEEQEVIDIISNAKPNKFSPNNCTLLHLEDRALPSGPLDHKANVSIYTIGSKTRRTFFIKDNRVIDIKGTARIIDSKGVAKLLFENNPSDEDITKDDMDEYKEFLKAYGLSITTSSKKDIENKFYPSTRRRSTRLQNVPIVEEVEGDGIKQPVEVVTIPSDEDELRHNLVLNLTAAKSGNDNTFNTVRKKNVRKENDNWITGKKYREILKTFYHV